MSQKREKGNSQKGKPNSDTVANTLSVEELDKAIHPTKGQNAKS
ncbi:hypothetical protein GA0061094_0978 [[Bacillus] enclensis]|uniref:Uncharacterized protein n=1 Tax=[Bacillus] enclensis TaxID=1402860 RepID=A0A1C3ZTX2_9BACI|nr:hypothetical protein [[Bacillus] enclensis]SCB85829.1 hypothetical protein GA0061094_0978 [[Bacillus] enclensis]